jgi:hypothetical protein
MINKSGLDAVPVVGRFLTDFQFSRLNRYTSSLSAKML